MLRGLRTVAVFVPDLNSARAWYAEVFERQPYFDEPFYVGFDVDGFELGLVPEEEEGKAGPGGVVAYWGVTDITEACNRLIWLGAQVDAAPHDVGGGIVVANLRDPWGNRLGLIYNPVFRLSAAAAGGTELEGPVAVVDKGARLAASEADLSDRTLVKEITVPAPVAEVWQLWTTSDGFKQWLVADAKVSLRLGGPFELTMMPKAPEGSRGSEGCHILSFVPERMLSFTWNAPPHLELTRQQRTWVVVDFTPTGNGTHLRLTHTGWPATGLAEPESQWPDTYDFFDRAWESVLSALAAHLAD